MLLGVRFRGKAHDGEIEAL